MQITDLESDSDPECESEQSPPRTNFVKQQLMLKSLDIPNSPLKNKKERVDIEQMQELYEILK